MSCDHLIVVRINNKFDLYKIQLFYLPFERQEPFNVKDTSVMAGTDKSSCLMLLSKVYNSLLV